ncbi:putative sucrase-isomaltase, intestinal [Apostichopus japonicus]|uniref:Putative sucrase-isomaltase, intestinal n=1 Tax=Stichopus japonicus TaxID=307972 RepID=A0A2G8LN42_STIJA|nr:putative sucrase-isomaltase, intestinal [Apostichopus japonicus]
MPSREFEIKNDDSLEVEPIASTISLIVGNALLVLVIAVMVAVICNTHPDYTHRFDCGPDRDGVDKATCERRGCIWSWPIKSGPPACFFPPNGYITYNMTDISPYPWGYRVQLRKRTEMPDFFDGGLETLWIDVELQTKYRLHIKIYDPENNRFEVPISLPRRPLIAAEDPLYNVSVTEEPFSFQVIRTDTNSVISVLAVVDQTPVS